jgi:outer membrane protein assembly factor BamB
MKKYIKIILIIFVLLIVAGVYFGYQIYQMTSGSEKLTGKLELIPEANKEFPPLTYGEADWPAWQGLNFDGKSNYTGIKTVWSDGLKKLWQVDYLCQDNSTVSWSAPVVQGNRLVIPGRDKKNDLVFCLNANNGDLIWAGSYLAETGTSHGPGSRATPFIDNDRIYTFGRGGDLVCWQLLDGKMLWRKNVKDEGGEEPDWGLSSTPIVFENKVIVQGGGDALIIAYDKISGEVIWKSMKGDSGYSATTIITINKETFLLVYHAMGLSCLEPEDGKIEWTVPWETDYGVNATTPLVAGNIIFHSAGYGMGSQALDVSNNVVNVLWTNKKFEAQHTDPVILDGYVYGYSGESYVNKGDFMCIELATGKEMWSTKKIGQGTLAYVDGHLICLDIKGNLYLVKPDPTGFNLIAEIKAALKNVKSRAWTNPVVANGKLYLRYMQQLVCYEL